MQAQQTRDDLPVRLIDSETERVVLSCILGRGLEVWMLAGPQLASECFAVDPYRRLFSLMCEIADKGNVPDLSGCYNAVVEQTGAGTPESIGLPRLSELAWNGEFRVTNLKDWVHRLKRKAAERRTWRLLEHARLSAESGGGLAEISRVREDLRTLEADFDVETVAAPTLGAAVSSIGIETLLAVPRGIIATPWDKLTDFTQTVVQARGISGSSARDPRSERPRLPCYSRSPPQLLVIVCCSLRWKCHWSTCSSAC